jgi:hypothetical protein
MSISIRDAIQAVANSPKIASGVATGTTGTGIGTVLDLIPDDIGKLATLIGIVLSSVLIYTHLRRYAMDSKKNKIDMAILKEKHPELFENS